MSCPAECTRLIFQDLKYNPMSGETVPLNLILHIVAGKLAVIKLSHPNR
jgi:hypothetical protein